MTDRPLGILGAVIALGVLLAAPLAHGQRRPTRRPVATAPQGPPAPAPPRVPMDVGVAARDAPNLWLATPSGYTDFVPRDLRLDETSTGISEGTLTVSSRGAARGASLLGQLVTIGVRTAPETFQLFHGVVTSVQEWSYESANTQTLVQVSSLMVPLGQVAGSEVYTNTTIPDAIAFALRRHPLLRVEMRISQRFPTEPMIVQYRETDRNFVSRLIEHAGLFALWEHDVHGSRLILTDQLALPRAQSIPLFPAGPSHPDDGARIARVGAALTSSTYGLLDVDERFAAIAAQREGTAPGIGALAMWDHPGGYTTRAEGDRIAALRLEEQRSLASSMLVETTHPGVRPGGVVELREQRVAERNGAYSVVSVATTAEVATGSARLQRTSTLTLARRDTPYRPSRTTSWPTIDGVQTATVIAPGAQNGRVRVRLHWATHDGTEPAAMIPLGAASDGTPLEVRENDEVLVAFIEGDPSRPLVVGIARR